GFLLFVPGVLFFLRKGIDRERGLLLIWILASLVFLTALRYKLARYALPYLPAVALITVTGLYEMPGKRLRNIFLMAVMALLVVQYYALGFTAFRRPHLGSVGLFQPEQIEFFPTHPRQQDWKLEEMLAEITAGFQRAPAQKKVVLGCNHPIYNGNTFTYLSNARNLGIRFIGAEYALDSVQAATDATTSYILLVEAALSFFDGNRARALEAVERVRTQPSQFKRLISFDVPDGERITLYGKP
ncbi:MAG: hypothetical protein HYR55_01545, partial [Acidobacteria bacterium]|nr:hypothetical protein [Acidobacteriota bacterium]MBI3657772.1 hypothetical protein [Acidobacteriota bacterium]